MNEQEQQQVQYMNKPVAEKFRDVPADQFREKLVGLRQAEDSIRDAVTEAVENGWLSPVQAIGVIAATTESVYRGTTGVSSGTQLTLSTPELASAIGQQAHR